MQTGNHLLDDEDNMRSALRLARRGLGRVAPNPAVGCVLVRNGVVIGRGWTQPGGRPHAETVALEQAGNRAKGATAYVTLEPCAHHGQTGPCAEALVAAGVGRVVIAMKDPDPRVSGRGIEILKQAGMTVDCGVLDSQAADINAGFILRIMHKRPLVTLKIATTADGMMRMPENLPPQITAAAAQRRMHLIRAEHDMILVGSGTAMADNPALDCRLPGMADFSPAPAIADRSGRLSADAVLRQNPALKMKAAKILAQATPLEMLQAVADDGVTRVMLEGGPTLAKAFLDAGLVDEIAHFTAPFTAKSKVAKDMPPPAQSDLQYMGIENLAEQTTFTLCGEESWVTPSSAGAVSDAGSQTDVLRIWRQQEPLCLQAL